MRVPSPAASTTVRLDRAVILFLETLEHDPEKCVAVFRKDHAQSKDQSAMLIHLIAIALLWIGSVGRCHNAFSRLRKRPVFKSGGQFLIMFRCDS
jgi:hypothetical protein